MVIGILKEIKANENRISMTPAGVNALVKAGHKVLVENNAGVGSGLANAEYEKVGAKIVKTNKEIYKQAEIVVKVKEPLAQEFDLFEKGQTIFTFLHLAADKPLADALTKSKITGISYDTIQLSCGTLPILTPMSEVAGRISVQVGATLLQKYYGGSGRLLGGVPGVPPGKVVIIGGGAVGLNAAKMAIGLGADVTIFDISKKRLIYIDDVFAGRIKTLHMSEHTLAEVIKDADLLISGILIPGAKAPKIVSAAMVKSMQPGSVVVDIAIDQGGSIETIDRVTTHAEPYYEKHGVIHYSVANMPGAVPRTSTFALSAVTLPYLLDMANKGVVKALKEDASLMYGLNTYDGHITYKQIADDLKMPYKNVKDIKELC
ncbi:MAG: alanine dehydrogenase [Firmicutes bacterium]|nr:alanine dehydrogenase [Bacillota bacterium]